MYFIVININIMTSKNEDDIIELIVSIKERLDKINDKFVSKSARIRSQIFRYSNVIFKESYNEVEHGWKLYTNGAWLEDVGKGDDEEETDYTDTRNQSRSWM